MIKNYFINLSRYFIRIFFEILLLFLRDNPTIRGLSLVNFIASFGAWFCTVAIYTMVVDFGSSELAIAIVTAMHFIPQ